jgi:hypothetical protein
VGVRLLTRSGTVQGATTPSAGGPAATRPWVVRRLAVILASLALILVGMVTTTGGAHLIGHGGWGLPNDLWSTLVAAERMLRGDLAHLYTPPTALVAPPGTAIVLLPAAGLVMALGLTPGPPVTQSLMPSAWWAAGTYEIAVSCLALFAADALAERMGVTLGRRAVLALAEAVALWNVSVRWGHPEDAVAVALLLYALIALADDRIERSGWLFGVGVAVQPLVVLALPILLAAAGKRRVVGYTARALGPIVAVLGVALVANARPTLHAVTDQPNYPLVDHPTPWIHFAPHLSNGVVAAGPGRIAAIAVACICGVVLARRPAVPGPWTAAELGGLVWWVALALALRVAFESVMVAYYIWPALAVALVASSPRWARLVVASVVAGALTFVSQATWRGEWAWWVPMALGVAMVVVVARAPLRADQGSQETWPCSSTYPTNAPVSMSAWAITSRGSRR